MVRSAPDRFFVPPYVGPSGWVGVWLDGAVDWDELADLLRDSYELVAPKRLLQQKKPRTVFRAIPVLLALFSGQLSAQQPPPDFDAYVKLVMQTFTVPGLSVAIVKDGRVVLARGYGVRRMGDPARVDARTRFGIASNTKLFTATALALLVEEGKIGWDKPVITYLPAFAMSDRT